MAQFKLTYKLEDQEWIRYVDEVVNENMAVLVCDAQNPDIPREASVKAELICE